MNNLNNRTVEEEVGNPRPELLTPEVTTQRHFDFKRLF